MSSDVASALVVLAVGVSLALLVLTRKE